MLFRSLRPVFPQERLLMEIVKKTPLKYINSSVWCANNRYYIDGESISVSFSKCLQMDTDSIIKELERYSIANENNKFSGYIQKFIKINKERNLYDRKRLSTLWNKNFKS